MDIIRAQCGQTARIAYQTENNRTQVRFDLSDIMNEFPGGTAVLTIRRPGDTEAVPSLSAEMEGTELVWTVTAWECERQGFLYAQVVYSEGETVAKTKIYRFSVSESLITTDGEEPDGWEDWVGQLTEAAADTRAAVESYDEMTAAATGLPGGSSPTAEIDRTGENPVLRLGIPAGEDSVAVTVYPVEAFPCDCNRLAKATITYTVKFRATRGTTQIGATCLSGYSRTNPSHYYGMEWWMQKACTASQEGQIDIKVTEGTDPFTGHVPDSMICPVNFTLEDGSTLRQTVTLFCPRDGYTPVRGTDYWTEEDQAAMRQDIAEDVAAARQAINDEKVLAVGAVETAGTTQVGLVTDEGTAQKAAVVAQGQETIASIPSDYTTLSNDVSDLKSAIDGKNGITDYYAEKAYVIGSAQKWTSSSARHISIPVSPGDTVSITAGASNSAVYAMLKSDNTANGVLADFCANTESVTWEERKVLNSGESSGTFTVPADGHILYLASKSATAQNLVPESVLINGIDISYNIRKKIDELSASQSGIQTEIDSIEEDIVGIGSDIENLCAEDRRFATKNLPGIWGTRKAYNRQFLSEDFSDIAFLSGISMDVYTDGYSIIHTIDLAKYKNASVNTYTVSTQVELESAIAAASSGDTIYLNEGIYTKIELTKSVNLIGKGRVVFSTLDLGTFASTSTDGIFRTRTLSTEPDMVLDLSHIDDGKIVRLRKRGVNNMGIQGCWAYSSNRVYAKPVDGVIPANTGIVAVTAETALIKCAEPIENATIYLENIIVVGGNRNVLYNDTGSYNSQKLIAKNCKFLYATQYNGISLYGVSGFFQNCECAFAAKDGFNYHKNNSSEYPAGPNTGTVANGLEIDCIGHDCGYGETSASPSDNGSTMHNGGTIVRINGMYYGNMGGNVADTSSGTVSYNYNCYCFDSTAPVDTNRADFWADKYAVMHLYGCRATGDSQYNLYAGANAEITVQNTEYTTHTGTIIET